MDRSPGWKNNSTFGALCQVEYISGIQYRLYLAQQC